ncbi:Dynein regulatory complex subunit 4, partial [Perkinsus olseni]
LMPPKKAKKAKKGTENDGQVPVDPALAARILALQKEARQIREEYTEDEKMYNQFLQEREKINYFWTGAKKTRNEREAELRNRERDLEDLQERNQIELKMFQQRLKHLRFHLVDQTIEQRISCEKASQQHAEATHLPREHEAFRAVRQTHVEAREAQNTSAAYLRALKLKQDERVLHLRQEYDKKARDLMQKYGLRMKTLRDEREKERKAELQRIEADKNRQVKELMHKNMREFQDIKLYYGDITSSNLEIIKRLKEEHAELKKREMADAKLMRELKRKNAALSDPLKRAREDVEQLKDTYASFLEDKRKIGVLKEKIAEQEKAL